jgi:hypothetical protein
MKFLITYIFLHISTSSLSGSNIFLSAFSLGIFNTQDVTQGWNYWKHNVSVVSDGSV